MFLLSLLKLQLLRNGPNWLSGTMETQGWSGRGYNFYGNRPNGLSGTIEARGWSTQGYQILRARVQPHDEYLSHGCPYAATVPYRGATASRSFS
jgi:hypothetical protein